MNKIIKETHDFVIVARNYGENEYETQSRQQKLLCIGGPHDGQRRAHIQLGPETIIDGRYTGGGYDLFGRDKKVLMGKFVSEQFKETHAAEWKTLHGPKSPGDVLRELAANYASPARWQKALIHLREEGKITDSPKDIGELMAAVPPDVLKECEQEIKDALWKWAWPNIRRSLTRGLPEWYKDLLLKKQFEQEDFSKSGLSAGAIETWREAGDKSE